MTKIYEFKDQIDEMTYEELVAFENVLANKVLVNSNITQGSKITDAKVAGELEVVSGEIKSKNWVSNTSGWRLTPTSGEFNFAISVDLLDIPDTTTTNSFHVDNTGNAWWGSTAIGTAPAKIEKDGKATFTDIVATGVINAQGGYLAAGVYVGTDSTAILCESTGLNVGTSGHIRGGQTDYNTGTGFFMGYTSGTYKFSIGDPTGQNMTWDGTNLRLNGQGVTVTRIYDTTSTWTKPSGLTMVEVICIGSGGGGGGGMRNSSGAGQMAGGGGGGGGAVSRGTIKAADLGATVTATVAVGGTAGAGRSTNVAGGNGGNGGISSFGTHIIAGGGGGGSGGSNQTASAGAGGGTITSANLTTRGTPGIATSTGIAGQGVDQGYSSDTGGAGGGPMPTGLAGQAGGGSIYGGPGGGCGAYSGGTGWDGGGNMRYTVGGGAAGGTDTNPGTAGSGSYPYCGKGGGGGGGAAVGGVGGTGAGGGGGGGANDPSSSGAGGVGGAGRIIVIEYY